PPPPSCCSPLLLRSDGTYPPHPALCWPVLLWRAIPAAESTTPHLGSLRSAPPVRRSPSPAAPHPPAVLRAVVRRYPCAAAAPVESAWWGGRPNRLVDRRGR